jgi:ABC-type sugar transport system substrate-binding protein
MHKVIRLTRPGFVLFYLVFFGLNSIPRLTAEEKIVIGFSQATMNHPCRVAMVDGNKKYAAEHYPEMALGAAKAVADAGRTKEIIIVGIDGENSAFEAIKNGKLAAKFIYPFCAPEGVVYAYGIAKGEQVPERVILKSSRVDASNVDQYLGKGF